MSKSVQTLVKSMWRGGFKMSKLTYYPNDKETVQLNLQKRQELHNKVCFEQCYLVAC